jgi:hypothetical protein
MATQIRLSGRTKIAVSLAATTIVAGAVLVVATGGMSSPYMNYVFWGAIAAIGAVWLLHFFMSPPRRVTKDELYDRAKYGPAKTNFHMDGWTD